MLRRNAPFVRMVVQLLGRGGAHLFLAHDWVTDPILKRCDLSHRGEPMAGRG